VGLTIAGCLFAIWARITLGANWSGRATVKAGHELITAGPYALARHPIYTGLLTACIGTAIGYGERRCLVGLLLIVLGFVIKMGQEERLMLETFPDAYAAYRRRVKALVPGVL
jgi:protein-S-isoprenylcysteine O-methyltransferase Ste14